MALLLLLCCFAMPAHADKKGKKEEKHGPPQIRDTYWKLIGTDGKELAGGEREAYIKLVMKHQKLEGYSGCNDMGGKYKIGKHNEISFEAMGTKMACDNAKTEDYMYYALSGANRFVINGENLLLYNEQLLLAIFEAKY